MEREKNKWRELRAFVVARQSDDKDGTSSTEAQLDHVKKRLAEVGMLYVDKVTLNGVSAASPARITEILEGIFQRKRTQNDFDVIAWQVEDRATRGGGEFGMWLEHEAKRHGLRVYFTDSEMDDRPYSAVIRTAKYEAAKEESVGKGRRSTQGHDLAKKKGFYRTAGQTPIGCDRLYLGEDHQPKFIIRNLGNGLQEQVDFKTKAVIGRFGSIGKKSHNRFKKQRNEYSLLVPGDRRQRRIVRVVFYLRYKRGWRSFRIAGYLNRLQVTAPRGGDWSPRQVQVIYENEAYTGVTYNDQTFSGRFFRRDKVMGFVALERDEVELVLRKTFTPKLRPMEEWDRIDQPYMYDFLPRDMRDLAIAAQGAMWQHRLDPTRPKKHVNAHPASTYLFSRRLVAKQDGQPLIGTLSGDGIEYYRHPKGRQGVLKGSVFNKLIAAKPLHEAAVKLLADALLDQSNLRERLTAFVVEHRRGADLDAPAVAELQAERDELKQIINATLRTLKGAALEDAQQELERLGNRRNEIEAKLQQIQGFSQRDARPVEQVVDEALAVLREQSRQLLTLKGEPLREAVNRLIPQLTVDMETKAVEMSIALPVWAMRAKPNLRKSAKSEELQVCPPTMPWSPDGDRTHLIFVTFKCEYEWRWGSTTTPPCYHCRRKDRTAA